MTGPVVGPIVSWITGTQVLALPKVLKQATTSPTTYQTTLAAEAAALASEALYRLSGSQFTGAAGPVTVRPIARPIDADSHIFGRSVSGLGYLSSWGACSAFGWSRSSTFSHYGCDNPPEVDLGAYPVTSIDEVTIDGVTIPSIEYSVRDYRMLVRIRPVDGASPTERYGWPTCQIPDMPLSERGTFGVTFHYGAPPPTGGVRAAKVLAQELWLSGNGDPHRIPNRATSTQKQGISIQLNDMLTWLAQRRTGLMEVDLWLTSLEQVAPMVWSPNVGRPRRVPSSYA